MPFSDRHAVITGGSSGIGLAIAQALLARGGHVHLLARNEDSLQEARERLVREHPNRTITTHGCDVADAGAVDAVFDELDPCAPTVLVNSAGVSKPGYFHELTLDDFDRCFRVNFFGTLHTVRRMVPNLMKRHDGYIVNVSSVAGLMGVFGYTAYGSSKFAVSGFSESLRQELRPHGITVTLLCPPDVDTPMLRRESSSLPRETKALNSGAGLLSPEEVATLTLNSMAAGRFLVVPGREAKLVSLAKRFAPRLVDRVMDRTIARARKGQGS